MTGPRALSGVWPLSAGLRAGERPAATARRAPAVLAPAAADALAPTTSTDPLPEPEPPMEAPRPDAAPEMVTIKLLADQRAQAHVFWGRKELGIAPLEVMRPRGSGPLDLLVLAEGYLRSTPARSPTGTRRWRCASFPPPPPVGFPDIHRQRPAGTRARTQTRRRRRRQKRR